MKVGTFCQKERWKDRRGRTDLGFGPRLQLLQLFGCSLNGGRSSQELVLSNDCGVLWVHPFCSWWGEGRKKRAKAEQGGQEHQPPAPVGTVGRGRLRAAQPGGRDLPVTEALFPPCPWSPLTLHGLSSLDELSDRTSHTL